MTTDRESFKEYVDKLVRVARRANADTACATFRDCKTWEGGHVVVLFIEKDTDKFTAVKNVVEFLEDLE